MSVVVVAAPHLPRADGPGRGAAVVEGVLALLVLTALVGGICSAVAWAAWRVLLLLTS